MDQVIAAATTGDVETLDALLAEDASLSAARGSEGVSVLLLALYHGQPAAAERLARGRGLDVCEAAALGRDAELQALLGADPGAARAFAADGFTALHLAAFFTRADTVRLLLDAGADPAAPARNAMRVQPLHSAVVRRGTEVPRLLLDAGAPVDARQEGGFTPLHAAAQNGDDELVDLLLARGANASLRTDDGRDAAGVAAEQGHDALARRLRAPGEGAGPAR